MLLWFIQVAIATAFVAVDIRTTPEATVMKWGFVIITLFSGLFGALLYVLSCREPLPGTHELYVAAKWRQVVGSTMHCVAGDGIGILAAAVITSHLGIPTWVDVLCEYALGFLFGWSVFQALFMKSMFGSYLESLRNTFMSELLSMNAVMGGMTAVMVPWMTSDMLAMSPDGPRFWFVMSIALCAGFVVALPMNWWLVDHGRKHGMMTVRPNGSPVPQVSAVAHAGATLSRHHEHGLGSTGRSLPTVHRDVHEHQGDMPSAASPDQQGHAMGKPASRSQLMLMTVISFLIFGVGLLVASILGDLTMHH
ncbi:DUF4396 domain-containing protein [Phyllobacterium salinisoli]|uniref:DUF4396 domain-containing protein n=2 Tax=Phyllobacterium salinisoli TaxID=1899321 RepID=A0A368JWV8_9HYPH|nr:DUF4396 domain-containing protein [Phyllobacterium salinisoli]